MGHIACGRASLLEPWTVIPSLVSLGPPLEDRRPCHPFLHLSQHGESDNSQDPVLTHKPGQSSEGLSFLYGTPVDRLVVNHRWHHRRLHGDTRQKERKDSIRLHRQMVCNERGGEDEVWSRNRGWLREIYSPANELGLSQIARQHQMQ
jgi:hypothetical protein